MNDEEFRAKVDATIRDARSWSDSELATEQERNLRYYMGKPIGNEVEGRSQIVSWDVFEVCHSLLPDLVEPFFSGDNVGEFEPEGLEDEQFAEQATDYINHIIRKRNPGFCLFQSWILDGLISKVGVVRCWWDQSQPVRKHRYRGLTDDQLTMLLMDGSAEVISHDAYADPSQPIPAPDGMQGMLQPQLHDIEIKRTGKPKGVCIDPVPPERLILGRRARDFKDAGGIIGEAVTYTRSELVEMGFKKARVAELSDYDFSDFEFVESLRYDEKETRNISNDEGPSEELTLFYGFVKCDYDGDGVAEWRRMILAGNDTLENEEVEEHEYCCWSPIAVPHRAIGMSYADISAPVQETNTTLGRQYLDSLYRANNPQTFAVDNQVRLEDLISRRIGGVVRMKAPGMAGPLQTTIVAREALEGIEWGNSLREQRTGVTRYNQGLDADSLNKTATGVSKIFSAAQKRTLMVLRVFAETGVKELFRKCLRLVTEYQDKEDVIRLRNEFVQMDPRFWNADMDVTINVGIGSGDKIETLNNLMMIGQYMEKAAASGLPFVQPENLYEFGKMLIKNAKVQGGEERLLTDPAKVPPKQPQPGPEQMIAQAQVQSEQIKAHTSIQTAQLKAQSDRERLQLEREIKGIELQIREQELRIKQADLNIKAQVAQDKLNGGQQARGGQAGDAGQAGT